MARFRKNPAFEREMRAEPEFQGFLRATTGTVAEAIVTVAPRKTGYYRRSIKARGKRVVIGDFFWFLIEYGSKNNVIYAPIRRGVRAVGLRFDDRRK